MKLYQCGYSTFTLTLTAITFIFIVEFEIRFVEKVASGPVFS